jgi:hypothetical protein
MNGVNMQERTTERSERRNKKGKKLRKKKCHLLYRYKTRSVAE